MKHFLIALLLTISAVCVSAETEIAETDFSNNSVTSIAILRDKKWIHGSADCETNEDPAIEVFRFDNSSYILRQNKCLSYEAPFIYVLFGDEKVLVLDTGATKNASDFPLYETVLSLISKQAGRDNEPELLVIHSHSHNDHHAGDSQFQGKPKVTVVEPSLAGINQFFAFSDWPNREVKLDLGGRELIIVPTPGHQEEAITIYDPHTKWLLTGDTFYPGYVYVKDWSEYKRSISRLVLLSKTHDVSAVLGTHIEMTAKAGEYYSIGTIFQPNEASLVLTSGNLESLNLALGKSDKAEKIVSDEIIVAPMNVLQRTISNIARWIAQ